MKTFMGYRVATLFDPVQTHVIHGLPMSELKSMQIRLKQVGASRFRVVKNKTLEDTVSLCFKLK